MLGFSYRKHMKKYDGVKHFCLFNMRGYDLEHKGLDIFLGLYNERHRYVY